MTKNENTIKDSGGRPKSLVIYFSFDEYALKALINNELWFARSDTFNDPFDCNIDIQFEEDDEEYIASVRAALQHAGRTVTNKKEAIAGSEELQRNWRQHLDGVIASTGVLCLSEDPSNIQMWSHYANKHTGFCVEIELSEDIETGGKMLIKVGYKEHPEVTIVKLYEMLTGTSQQNIQVFEMLMAHKEENWSYEREWRLFTDLSDGEKGATVPMPGKITKIRFGLKMQSKDKQTIQNILGPDVQYCDARRVPYSFKLEFDEVDQMSQS